MQRDGFGMKLETIGEHLTAAGALEQCADLQEEMEDGAAAAHQTRAIASHIRTRGEVAARSAGIELPTYTEKRPLATRLDQFLSGETLAAMRIIERHASGSELGQATSAVLTSYDEHILSGIVEADHDED